MHWCKITASQLAASTQKQFGGGLFATESRSAGPNLPRLAQASSIELRVMTFGRTPFSCILGRFGSKPGEITSNQDALHEGALRKHWEISPILLAASGAGTLLQPYQPFGEPCLTMYVT